MKYVLVEMEESVQKIETELSPVLVQLFTKASCVNKEVRVFKYLFHYPFNGAFIHSCAQVTITRGSCHTCSTTKARKELICESEGISGIEDPRKTGEN